MDSLAKYSKRTPKLELFSGEAGEDFADLLKEIESEASASAEAEPTDEPAKTEEPKPETKATPAAVPATAASNGRLFVSPIAAKMASENNLNLKSISGSGPNGRIIKRDIEKTLAGGGSAQAGSFMQTVEVSKNVIGETRTAGESKIVERREITGDARTEITGQSYIREGDARNVKSVKGTRGKGEKDDLTKIEGIGPKINGLLNDGGIYTFRELAETEVAVIQEILNNAGKRYKMHNPATWPAQSEMAADGRWDDLKKWQDELDGGR